MDELRFDGRVAVVTGAGRGLGRAYAELLASRGAKVLVNDPGVSLNGDATAEAPAEATVRVIKAAGGEAKANNDTVATKEGGSAIIEDALKTYGRVDILIHNAGIVRRANLRDMSADDFESVLDVHLRGAFHVVRAAFPAMCDAGYGRIVLTGSVNGLYGNAGVANYSAAKAGVATLSHVAAIEGSTHGVISNVILPAAVTRMSEGVDTSAFPPMDPDLVAPAVAWLCHETCSITGEMLIAMAGRIAKAYTTETRGVYRPEWTIEGVGEAMEMIRDTEETVVFAPVPTGQLDHLRYGFAMASEPAPR